MSLLDNILGLVGGKGGADGIFGAIGTLINENGGLPGLVQKFQQGGLTEAVNSWIGLGENHAISENHILQVLGSDKIQALAKQFGLDGSQLASQIAGVLPQVIDKLTPDGELPKDNNLVGQALQLLQTNLFK